LRKLIAARGFVGQTRLREGALRAHDALGDCRGRHEESPCNLFGRQAADHPQRQRRASLARQMRVTRGEDEPKHLIADVIV